MAGTGSGMLQPTKLVQSDDFMDSIALPGYFTTVWSLASNLSATTLFIVPDGMTAEIMDFGLTVQKTSTTANTNADLVLSKDVNGSATALTGGIAWNTADVAGTTKSVLRGDIAYTADADTQAERQLGAGTALSVAGTKGSAAVGIASVWVRLKFVSNDARTI
tara:strand:- start:806 stop:1294 length:489 start_codon:yes stop_codon:yes gene_type:complete